MAKLARKVTSFDDSLFCRRLEAISKSHKDDTALANLVTATRRLLSSATAIAEQVAKFLPQFTLHDDVHLWNVLGFMEELAGGEEGIDKLEAGDCAMAVWAAFIHDLGMVLDAEELAALDAADGYDKGETKPGAAELSDPRKTAWRVHRDQQDHWESIRKDPDSVTSRMKLGIIRADYVRVSHARIDALSGHCRIADWLDFLAKADRLVEEALDEYTLGDRVVRVAVSHNQNADWLPRQLSALGIDEPRAEFVSNHLGTIHWTWIGWLLRLADVFDCDKSRTPKILFDHAGITHARSQTEWQKHLAIPEPPQWQAGADQQSLLYTCRKCPSPVVEKAIHEIVGWMNDEIGKVRSARDAVKGVDLPALALPSKATVDVKQREGGYLYDDMEFRLDRDAVIELLMGESLYGGPELALRELVQNALDAVHLRDMRNRLAEALDGTPEKLRQPCQPFLNKDLKRVDVTWGTEADKHGKVRQFIRVRDYGVGMTIGTMKRFLTRIGKSYYKSDEFRAEQELMRRNGILCTAISQFGIGFLSVFMLADEVTIHTRPVEADKALPAPNTPPESLEEMRFPFRAEIHGPHGLLAFYPDQTVTQPGTTVTVWLKERFDVLPWNREWVIAKLKGEFYAKMTPKEIAEPLANAEKEIVSRKKRALDPAFQIGRFVVWPLYPVRMSHAADAENPVVLSGTFHARELLPLNREAMREKAAEWGHTIPEIATTDWEACDWVDERMAANGMEGTGSRIRLVAPRPNGRIEAPASPEEWGNSSDTLDSGAPTLLLGSFCEVQLPELDTRYQCLVNGVRIVPGLVPGREVRDCKLEPIIKHLPMLSGVGGWVWIDLRGKAMPRLRADRSAPVASQTELPDRNEAMSRWLAAWPTTMAEWVGSVAFCHGLRRPQVAILGRARRVGRQGVGPDLVARLVILEENGLSDWYGALPGDQRLRVGRDRARDRALDGARDRALARARDRKLIRDRNLNLDLDHALALVRVRLLDRSLGRSLDRSLDLARNLARDLARDLASDLASDLDDNWRAHLACWRKILEAHLASEGVWPDPDRRHPASGLSGVSARVGELELTGPLHVERRAITDHAPTWLRSFDLCGPYTAFPLRKLAASYPQWGEERGWRALWMLPFLFGKEPGSDWRKRLARERPFDALMLFMPNPNHYEWLFADHTPEEWSQGSASALWDLTTGKVLYADGVHTDETLRRDGKPLHEWLKIGDE
jgi:hypothetical protein